MIWDIAFLCAGCGLLYFGGDWLVDGILGLAHGTRLPPVLIAFVAMEFGTSAPELFVAIKAVLAGTPDVAVGNVIGSNIVNLLLVLALTALALWGFMADGTVSRLDGLVLILAMLVYVAFRFMKIDDPDDDVPAEGAAASRSVAIAALALVALPVGAHLFVGGAVGVAGFLGVSKAL